MAGTLWLLAGGAVSAQGPFPGPGGAPLPFIDRAAAVDFLADAPLADRQEIGEGTNPRKWGVTLRRDGLEVRAVFRFMYDHKPQAGGFLDSYRSELAAQELAQLLGLPYVPPTAARKLRGKRGSLQLWIYGATPYSEITRRRGGASDPPTLARQLDVMRLFDALIANQDRNPGNVLIGDDGRVWWIDHSRSFGGGERLRGLESVTGCERGFLRALASLDEADIERRLRPYTPYVDDLLRRRRGLLAWIEEQVRRRGESAFLRDDGPSPVYSVGASDDQGGR